MIRNVMGFVGLGLFVLALQSTGCPKAAPVVAPVANAAACIAEDALGGKSLAQIAADCAVTVEEVVVALLNVKDAPTMQSRAYKEAMSLKSKLMGMK